MLLGVQDFGAFIVASVLLILSPGPGTLAILGAAAGSRRAGFAALAGTSLGDAALMAVAAIGAAALLTAYPFAFDLLRYGGGAYLAWLGVQSLLSRTPGFALSAPKQGEAFRRSLLVTLLNPKAIIFCMAFFPQFVGRNAHPAAFVVLGATFIFLNCLWQTGLIVGANRIASHLDAMPRFALWVNRVLGVVFILFGVRLALG